MPDALQQAFKTKNDIRWKSVEEIKGMGMKGTDKEGNIYFAGSYKAAASATDDNGHNVYILKNDILIGWIDVADEIRPEAAEVVQFLQKKGIRTILLSGDTNQQCALIAKTLKMDEFHGEQTPAQKMAKIEALTKEAPTAMVGDGINDAPALAKATIGISLSDATQLAMQSAQVVLMNQGLRKLPTALGLGKAYLPDHSAKPFLGILLQYCGHTGSRFRISYAGLWCFGDGPERCCTGH